MMSSSVTADDASTSGLDIDKELIKGSSIGSKLKVKKKKRSDRNTDSVGKHLLQTAWKYWWFDKERGNRGGNWADSIREVMGFSSVEDFWSIHYYIKCPSELKLGDAYYVFRKGIKPMWEDPANRRGGRWLINMDKRHCSTPGNLDNVWENVLLLLIGEAFGEEGEDITGLVVDLRPRFDRIAIWTTSTENRDAIMKIGTTVQNKLLQEVKVRFNLVYEAHNTEGEGTRRQEQKISI